MSKELKIGFKQKHSHGMVIEMEYICWNFLIRKGFTLQINLFNIMVLIN